MFRLQVHHIEVLVEFMESHPDFARGRLSVSNSREKFKELWNTLTIKLNSLGSGEKSTEKWQKTWSDYKGNLKKKTAEIRSAQNATGGGPPLQKKITDLELRILAILGSTFIAGVGVEERGLNVAANSVEIEHTPSTSQGNEPRKELSAAKITLQDQGQKRNLGDSDSDEVRNDHDYLYINPNKKHIPKKRKNKNLGTAYEETIECLKKIDNTVAVGLSNINQSLKEGLMVIKESLKKNF